MIVQRITGLPWVADFRDPWTRHPHAARQFAVVARASEVLERSVMSRIDKAVIVDESVELLGVESLDPRVASFATVSIRRTSPELCVRSGRPTSDCRTSEAFTAREMEPQCSAHCAVSFDGGVLDKSDFELRLVGDAKLPPNFALGGLSVTQTGYVDHRQAFEEMMSASALLLYLPP